jgi:DNA-binding MarR family transcriptional regulator
MHPPDQFVFTLVEWSEIWLHNSMSNFFRYSKESGLSMSQIGVLFQVLHKGNSAVSGIGEELGITCAAASQMLDRLVKQGLILRSEDPSDRRMKQIVLTDKGRYVVQESICARQSWFGNLASALSETEKGQVVTALNILIDKANLLNINTDLNAIKMN